MAKKLSKIQILIFLLSHFYLFIQVSSTYRIDIYSLYGDQEKISKAYKDSMIESIKMIPGIVNKTDEKLLNYTQTCIEETENLYNIRSELFFNMFEFSGLARKYSFGSYDQCMRLNEIFSNPDLNKNSKFHHYQAYNANITKFIIVEEFKLEKESISFGACIPAACSKIISAIENKILPLKSVEGNIRNYTLTLFPQKEHYISSSVNESKFTFVEFFNLLWVYLLITYIVLLIFLNIYMDCKFSHYNPYDTEKLKINNKDPLQLNQLGNNIIENQHRIYRTNTQLQRERTNYSNDIIYTENLIFRRNTEEDYASSLNYFQKMYYNYFSLSNNFYLLSTNKSAVYNDSHLRMFNGVITLFSFFHVMSCVLDLMRIISKKDNITDNEDFNYNPFVFIFPMYQNYGKAWLEVLAFFWGFFITYKYINRNRLEDENRTEYKILRWIFRHVDKLIIFLLLNLWFVFSLDYIMHKYFKDNIIWFLFDKNAKICSPLNFLPFYDFYVLISGQDLTPRCMKSNCVFFQGFYILVLSLIILKYVHRSTKKFKILAYLMLATFIIRTASAMIYSYITHQKNAIYVVDILHAQFYYNLPNMILGIMVSYVYFYETDIENINRYNLFKYFVQFDKIRNFFYKHKTFKNLCFITSSLLLFFYCGFINKIVDLEFIKKIKFFFLLLLSINGFITTFLIALIILCVKLKGSELWKVNNVLVGCGKHILKSNVFLIISRCMFTINLGHIGILYFIISLIVKSSIIFDFFTVYEFYGVTICILIYFLSFIATLMIEVPLRIFFKKLWL
jgi:hypothetical protein